MKLFKVMLVEDDEFILDDLKEKIDWQAYGFQIVGTARNGKAAIKLHQQFHPDLIITDIIMPLMNGIEMMEAIRKVDTSVSFIVLSTYGEFQYAKDALLAGASDYLLKLELSPSVLAEKMRQFYLKLSNRNLQNMRATQLELQHFFSQSEPKEFQWMFQTNPERQKLFYLIASSNMIVNKLLAQQSPHKELELLLEQMEALPFLNDTLAHIRVFPADDCIIIGGTLPNRYASNKYMRIQFCKEVLKHMSQIQKDTVKLIYADFPLALSALRKTFHRYYASIAWTFFTKETITSLSDVKALSYQTGEKIISFDTLVLGEQNTKDYLHKYATSLFQSHDYHGLVNTFLSVCEQNQIEPSSIFKPSVFETSDTYFEFLLQQYNNYHKRQKSNNPKQYSPVIQLVIRYIQEEYANPDLSLDDIARHSGMSKSHLCVLFKTETEKTINEWLTEQRIRQSINLLKTSNYKIYEISDKVGYRSSQYFSRIFYQITGKKPLDYRKKDSVKYFTED